ncbi:hypothetical protein BH11ARM2_BH11ARM2_38260 [soil metagenome]
MSRPWIAGFEARGAWLARDLGLEPVGQVIGNGVFIPIIVGTPATSMEVSSSSRLATTGWTSALDRLIADAKEMGADGVVDIRLSQRIIDQESGAKEFSGIGTAVRGLRRSGEIWSTILGPEDLAILLRSGFAPVRYVIGCCTWHQSVYPWQPKYANSLRSLAMMTPQEFDPGTKATYTAREIAQERMAQMANEAGASGIVAVTMRWNEMRGAIQEGAVCGCEAFGTAIVPARGVSSLDVNCAIPLWGP